MKKFILFLILFIFVKISFVQSQSLYIWFGQADQWDDEIMFEKKNYTESLPPTYENRPFNISNVYSGYVYEILLINILVHTPYKRWGMERFALYSAKNSPPVTVLLSELGNYVNISEIKTMLQVGQETAELTPINRRFFAWGYFEDRDIYLVEKNTNVTPHTATISKVKLYNPPGF